jgi:hypothetical protein
VIAHEILISAWKRLTVACHSRSLQICLSIQNAADRLYLRFSLWTLIFLNDDVHFLHALSAPAQFDGDNGSVVAAVVRNYKRMPLKAVIITIL